MELYKNPGAVLEFEQSKMYLKENQNKEVKDIAFVECKKKCEGAKSCPPSVLVNYAKNDREFLIRQIEILAPHIIFCCGTGDSRGAIYNAYGTIYKGEEINEIIRIKQFSCHKHKNKLVIYFRHPSYIIGAKNEKMYFDKLYELIKKGNVYENFDWNSNAN